MENKRRSFLKNITATGAAAICFPSLLNAMPGKNKVSNEDGKSFTFLFQGDSITDGNRTRNNDWNHVMGHGYAYLIACRLWYDHIDKGFHFFNRGVSGNKVTDLNARWQTDTVDLKPDVLSILVGVNDANSVIDNHDVVTVAAYEEMLRSLLKQTKEQLPKIKIVLCEPFILPVGRVKDNWNAWSAEIQKRQDAVKKISLEFNTMHVPLQEDFNNACKKAPAGYWIWDGIHPMPAGHELIARKWINTVKKELLFIK
ncbi:MAG TPA: SGNH/GDSL hydrolase family protein [Panacibacter sp.]|nr:SGNH/GDSL hydrolase family protein [Panacibacter sp.]